MKKGKIAVIAVIVAAAIVGAYFFIWKKKTTSQAATPQTPGQTPGHSDQVATPGTEFYVKAGDKNSAQVKAIQIALNSKYKAGLKVDGNFGPKTAAALKKAGYNGSGLAMLSFQNLTK